MTSRHDHLFGFSWTEKSIKFDEDRLRSHEDDYGSKTLVCPCCGGTALHHYGFTDYNRDEDHPWETVVDRGSVVFEKDCSAFVPKGSNGMAPVGSAEMPGYGLQVFSDFTNGRNPSSRRTGIVVKFWCENCFNISLLCISQHKGESYVGWRVINASPKKNQAQNN